MRKAILSILAMLAFLMLAPWTDAVFGQLIYEKSIGPRGDDVNGDTLIESTGTYDPCCNFMCWQDKFRRTFVDRYYWLRFHYNGTTVHHQYLTYNYEHGQSYEFTGEQNVGPSTSHELVLSKSIIGSAGSFDNIVIKAVYYNSGGSKRVGP